MNGYLVGPLEPGGFGIEFGFGAAFRGIRAGEAILTATEQLESLTAAQKEAIRGYVKTMLRKLGAHSTADLVRFAAMHRLLDVANIMGFSAPAPSLSSPPAAE